MMATGPFSGGLLFLESLAISAAPKQALLGVNEEARAAIKHELAINPEMLISTQVIMGADSHELLYPSCPTVF